jgi:hypothetical protein
MKKSVLTIAAIAIGIGSFATSSAFAVSPERVERLKEKKVEIIKELDDKKKKRPEKTIKFVNKQAKKPAKSATEKIMREAGIKRAQINKAQKEIKSALEEKIRKDASPR